MNKSGLVFRLAIVVIFAATAVGFLATQVFYRITFLKELEHSKHKITQLHTTVSSTASIATYLEDKELVTEVINGLVSNDIILGAEINTQSLHISSKIYQKTKDTIEFGLFSPFEKERKVGSLSITPNLVHITNRAKAISFDNTVAEAIQAFIITLVVIFVAYGVITRPIIGLAKRLHNIIPGTNERLDIPPYHVKSELGSLVIDINNLLQKTEAQLEEERGLRSEVERLSKHFRTLFENSTSPIILTEPKGNILLYNEAFSSLLKRLDTPLRKSFGPYLKEIFHEQRHLDEVVEIALGNEEIASGEFKLLNNKNNESIWVQAIISSSITEDYKEHYQITLHDISKRKLQLENLDKKAHTDALTQLLNRRGAEQELILLMQNKTPFILILLDLNKFKPINDIYGHEAGDEILIHIASQLTKGLRRRDILSRWGGDEFVIVLPNLSVNELSEVAIKIHEHISTPLYLANQDISVQVGASMGASIYPEDNKSLKVLIESADKAMYWSKEKQKMDKESYFSLYRDLPISSD